MVIGYYGTIKSSSFIGRCSQKKKRAKLTYSKLCPLHTVPLIKLKHVAFLTPQQTGVNFCFSLSVSCCLSSLSATPSLSSDYHCRAEMEREKETPPSTPLQKKPPSITHRKPNPNTITSSYRITYSIKNPYHQVSKTHTTSSL